MTQVTSVRHTLVGSLLRQYREAQDYKLEDAARILKCDRSRISRVETGERGIRPQELRDLLTEYGVDEAVQDTLLSIARPRQAHGWWQGFRRMLPTPLLDFIVAEDVASSIQIYAPSQIPDLLWTPDYAREVVGADPTVSAAAAPYVVTAVTAHRGPITFNRQPDLTVVLGEAALRQRVGSRDVMRAQLAHIAKLSGSEYPWLTIRLLPFNTGAIPAGNSGAFSILSFEHLPGVGILHVAGPAGGRYLDDADSVQAYAKVFNHLQTFSMTPEQSIVRIRQLAH